MIISRSISGTKKVVLPTAAKIAIAAAAAAVMIFTAACGDGSDGSTDSTDTASETQMVITRAEGEAPDFTELAKINPDIYAWLYIEGTDIDYPIAQNEDNTYYLTHAADKSESDKGSLFTETYNSKDFSDYMTVVYGRTPDDGTLFSELPSYRDRVFFDANRVITVYTPEKILTYKIFAAYVWDDRHLLLNFDFTDEEMRSMYITYVQSLSGTDMNVIVDDTVEVTSDDKLLTLCCGTGNEGERYLVQAVLTNGQDD